MYAHTNTNRDSDANSDTDRDTNSHANAYTYSYAYTDTHCYTKAYSDTAAPSAAAAAPDSAALKEIISEESPAAAARDWSLADCRCHRLQLQLATLFRRRFGKIHFVDLSVKGATADAELFGCRSHVAIRGCKRLGDQFLFGLVQIERTRLFPKSLS